MPWEEANNIHNVTDYCQKFLGVIYDNKSFDINKLCSKEAGTNVKAEFNLFHYYYELIKNDDRTTPKGGFSLDRCKRFEDFFETIYYDLYATSGRSEYWTHLSRAVKALSDSLQKESPKKAKALKDLENLQKKDKDLEAQSTNLEKKSQKGKASKQEKKALQEEEDKITKEWRQVREDIRFIEYKLTKTVWAFLDDKNFKDGIDKLVNIVRKGKDGGIAVPFSAVQESRKTGEVDKDTTYLKIDNSDYLTKIVSRRSDGKQSLGKLKRLEIVFINEIDANAFPGLPKLRELVISSFKTIGIEAFRSCVQLKTLLLQNVVDRGVIFSRAFENCSSLEKVNLPEKLATIDTHAFAGCKKAIINVPSSVGIISDSAFSGCKSVSVKISSLLSAGRAAFSGCGTVRLVFSKGGSLIAEADSFAGCTDVRVKVPSTDSEDIKIGKGVFKGLEGKVKWLDMQGKEIIDYNCDRDWFDLSFEEMERYRAEYRQEVLARLEREGKDKSQETSKKRHKHKHRPRTGATGTDGNAGSVAGSTEGKTHKHKHRPRTSTAKTDGKARSETDHLGGADGVLKSTR